MGAPTKQTLCPCGKSYARVKNRRARVYETTPEYVRNNDRHLGEIPTNTWAHLPRHVYRFTCATALQRR